MDELIKKLLSEDLAALEGLHVTGSVPVRQELINEVIATVLAEGLPTKKKADPSDAPAPAPVAPISSSGGSKKVRLDPNVLLSLVKRAEIKADDGKITFEFEIRR